jgi:hypothetical protein
MLQPRRCVPAPFGLPTRPRSCSRPPPPASPACSQCTAAGPPQRACAPAGGVLWPRGCLSESAQGGTTAGRGPSALEVVPQGWGGGPPRKREGRRGLKVGGRGLTAGPPAKARPPVRRRPGCSRGVLRMPACTALSPGMTLPMGVRRLVHRVHPAVRPRVESSHCTLATPPGPARPGPDRTRRAPPHLASAECHVCQCTRYFPWGWSTRRCQSSRRTRGSSSSPGG